MYTGSTVCQICVLICTSYARSHLATAHLIDYLPTRLCSLTRHLSRRLTTDSKSYWDPIYKESYARLMTAKNLRRTYAELVKSERLTKNHKLNLRKIYAKLTQNLGKTYDHICHFTDPWSFSLFANQTRRRQNKAYDTSESFLLEYFRKRSFRCGVGPYTLAQVFTFKSLFHK